MEALERAIKHAGSQKKLAELLSTSQARVWNWLRRDKKVPAEYAVEIERATSGAVTREQLRPDIFEDRAA